MSSHAVTSSRLRARATVAGVGDKRRTAPGRPSSVWADGVRFFASFLRRPAQVGALFPSSQALARTMVDGCNLSQADTVVELGPGTGAITRVILDRVGKGALFLTLELDATHARSLRQRFPEVATYCDSAEQLGHYLARKGRRKASAIISGLPWANLPVDVQDRILQAILQSLSPSGVFATFSYSHARWLPRARRFREMLGRSFQEVRRSPVIWRNLPPAFVYRCYGPKLSGDRGTTISSA